MRVRVGYRMCCTVSETTESALNTTGTNIEGKWNVGKEVKSAVKSMPFLV